MRRLLLGSIVLSLAISQPLWGQTGAAGQKALDNSLEASPVGTDGSALKTAGSTQSPAPPGAFDVTRVLLALGGVIGLIFFLRACAKRMFPSAAAQRGGSAVKILSRCAIAPRQHLLVVQFGKRLVLVGDAGAHLNPLCEITDAEEIAGVLAQSREETISIARRFESLFGRARQEFGETEQTAGGESFDNSTEIPAENPSLNEAQKELADLHDKVREVARKIGRA